MSNARTAFQRAGSSNRRATADDTTMSGTTRRKVLIELDGLAFHSTPRARITDGRRDRSTVMDGWATLRAYWPDVVDTPCALTKDVGALLSSRG